MLLQLYNFINKISLFAISTIALSLMLPVPSGLASNAPAVPLASTQNSGQNTADGWQTGINSHPLAPPRLVAVAKKDQQLFMFEKNSPPKITAQYSCTTGQIIGDKQFENDLKTPEGVYFVTRKLDSGLDFEQYGYEAYTLNYPNPVDKLRKKTGYGIWIHGKGRMIGPLETRGCVALNNNDIAVLGRALLPGTPVTLASEVNPKKNLAPEEQKTVAVLEKKVRDWAKAWSNRSNGLFDYYDANAYTMSQPESFSQFRSQKERIFKSMAWIEVKVQNIQVLRGPGYWVTWFQQDYKAPNLATKGVRRLYWQEDQKGELRIIGMEWIPGLDTDDVMVADLEPAIPAFEKNPHTESDASPAASEPKKAETVKEPAKETARVVPKISLVAEAPATEENKKQELSITLTDHAPERALIPATDVAPVLLPERKTGSATIPVQASSEKSRLVVTAENKKSEKNPEIPYDVEAKTVTGTTAQDINKKPNMPDAKVADTTNTAESLSRAAKTVTAESTQPKMDVKADTKNEKSAEPKIEDPKTDNKKLAEVPQKGKKSEVDNLAVLAAQGTDFVEKWRKDWEKGNVKAYSDYYANNATQGNKQGAAAIAAHKQQLWSRKAPAKVKLTNLRFTPESDGLAIEMTQEYKDKTGYVDTGKKIIHLKQVKGTWKIVNEEWSPL